MSTTSSLTLNYILKLHRDESFYKKCAGKRFMRVHANIEFPQSQARASDTKTDDLRFSHNGIVNGNIRSHVLSSHSVDKLQQLMN